MATDSKVGTLESLHNCYTMPCGTGIAPKVQCGTRTTSAMPCRGGRCLKMLAGTGLASAMLYGTATASTLRCGGGVAPEIVTEM